MAFTYLGVNSLMKINSKSYLDSKIHKSLEFRLELFLSYKVEHLLNPGK